MNPDLRRLKRLSARAIDDGFMATLGSKAVARSRVKRDESDKGSIRVLEERPFPYHLLPANPSSLNHSRLQPATPSSLNMASFVGCAQTKVWSIFFIHVAKCIHSRSNNRESGVILQQSMNRSSAARRTAN
jgi:hypothetical protein